MELTIPLRSRVNPKNLELQDFNQKSLFIMGSSLVCHHVMASKAFLFCKAVYELRINYRLGMP